MDSFEYARPTSVQQALRLLGSANDDTAVLAGGTDLLSRMKDYISIPRRVVSLRAIRELRAVSYSQGSGLRIGATTTIDELLKQPQVRQQYAGLYQALELHSSPQIRTMGTVGGSLLQRPRCWYYRNGYGLLGQREGQSLVTNGDNRYHAILGNEGPAYYVQPSTLAPILVALGARVRLVGPNGQRDVELERFYTTPKSESDRENVAQPNEILTEILVPPANGQKTATYELRQKYAFDWPLTMAAVALRTSGSTVNSARVVLGQVAPIPWLSAEAAQAVQGKSIDEATATQAGAAAVQNARPLSRNAYKVQLTRVAVKRALLRAVGAQVPAFNEEG
jgi:xanthine dehydrogenase YagS FAD-binding subunit